MPLLARELREGGEASAVVERARPPADAAALVWIGAADDESLRAASPQRAPIVGLTEGESLPYVLDTNLVRLAPGRGASGRRRSLQALARVARRRRRRAGCAAAGRCARRSSTS